MMPSTIAIIFDFLSGIMQIHVWNKQLRMVVVDCDISYKKLYLVEKNMYLSKQR